MPPSALTRRALYVDKSLFGPCDFVMGADTASRVLDAKCAAASRAWQRRRTRCGAAVVGLWWRAGSGNRAWMPRRSLGAGFAPGRRLEIPDFGSTCNIPN